MKDQIITTQINEKVLQNIIEAKVAEAIKKTSKEVKAMTLELTLPKNIRQVDVMRLLNIKAHSTIKNMLDRGELELSPHSNNARPKYTRESVINRILK